MPGTAVPLLGPGSFGLDADTTDSRVEPLRSGQDDFAEIGLDPVAHEVRADNHPQPRPAELVGSQAEVVGPVPLGDCCLQGFLSAFAALGCAPWLSRRLDKRRASIGITFAIVMTTPIALALRLLGLFPSASSHELIPLLFTTGAISTTLLIVQGMPLICSTRSMRKRGTRRPRFPV